MEKIITKVFSECQHSTASHPKLVKKLINVYLKSDFEKFTSYFVHLLKYALIHGDKQPSIERTLTFIAKFSTSVKTEKEEEANTNEETEDGEEEIDIDPFLVAVIEFLLKNHEANSRSVRYRVCQLINRILNSMGEQASIDDELYNIIYDTMLQRLMDKVPAIRVQAIHALSRLQEPRNKECPVIKAYLFHLSMDPNPEVRKAVLNNIAITFQTLPSILERIRDTRDLVRRQAYLLLAQKVHLRSFTIAQRVLIVSEGLKDRSEIVRQAVKKNVLQAWLRLVDGSLLNLLKCMDVEASTESAELALHSLFEGVPCERLVENFVPILKGKVVPFEELKSEAALLWKCLAKHLRNQQAEEHLEEILPDLSAFSNYLRDYILLETPEEEDPQETAVKMMEKDFVCQQLITLTTLFDMGDEVGRKNLCSLARELFLNHSVGEMCIKNLADVYTQLYPPMARVDQLMEIISELREQPEADSVEQPQDNTESIKETPKISEEEERKHKVKVAKIRVKLNDVREELRECVQSLDLEKAQLLKARLLELEEERDRVIAEGAASSHTPKAVVAPSQNKMPDEEEEELKLRADPLTLSRCLLIVCEFLTSSDLTTLGSPLRSLHDHLILPCLKSEDLGVRRYAVRALALTCLLSKDLAQQHLLLFVQISQMDVEEIQVEALRSLFDFWVLYGVEEFNAVAEDVHELPGFSPPDDSEDNQAPSVGNMIALLTKMLETDSSEARTLTVEGLCKLLLTSRIESSKLLSHLVLLWYNPTTEEDHLLRHMLGVFFPLYASQGGSNQESLCGALLPTLHTIFDAPIRSPLTDIDLEDVINFLVSITSPSLVSTKAKEVVNAHDSLVFLICAEILAFTDREYSRGLVKCLPHLALSPTNFANLKQILCLTQKMTKKVSERSLLNCVNKFQQSIQNLLQVAPLEDEAKETAEDATIATETEGSTEEMEADSTISSFRRKRVLYSSQNDIELFDSENDFTPSKLKRQFDTTVPGQNEVTKENCEHEERSEISKNKDVSNIGAHEKELTKVSELASSADELELTVEEGTQESKVNNSSSDLFATSQDSPKRTNKVNENSSSEEGTLTNITSDECEDTVGAGEASKITSLTLSPSPTNSDKSTVDPKQSGQKRKTKPRTKKTSSTSPNDSSSSSPSYYSARSTSNSPELTPPVTKRLRNTRVPLSTTSSESSKSQDEPTKRTSRLSSEVTQRETRLSRSSRGQRLSANDPPASNKKTSRNTRLSSSTTEQKSERKTRSSVSKITPKVRSRSRSSSIQTPVFSEDDSFSTTKRRPSTRASASHTPSSVGTSTDDAQNVRRSTRKRI